MTLPDSGPTGAAHAASRMGSVLRRAGVWVTAPDESGLMLFLQGNAVRDSQGNPVVRTWEELTRAGRLRLRDERRHAAAGPEAAAWMNALEGLGLLSGTGDDRQDDGENNL